MAPEQARGEEVDSRADLFSLGCLLYRLSTGVPPFGKGDTVSILVAIATSHPPAPISLNPVLPAAMSELIQRLLAKRPEDRPPSARALADALRDLEVERERRRTWPSRRRWLALTALVTIAAVGLTVWLLPREDRGEETPPDPGEVTFALDEPEGQLILRGGDGVDQPVDVATQGTLSLAPGEYTLRPQLPRKGRHLFPDRFLVNSGERTKVALRLVGEIRRLDRHTLPVKAVALSEYKNKLLAISAAMDRDVVLWKPATDDQPVDLTGHEGFVCAVAIAPNGWLAASGSGGRGRNPDLSIRLWDLDRQKELHRLQGHESWVTALAFASDNKYLLSGSKDGTAILWDLLARQKRFDLKGHENGLDVYSAACSGDGRHAVTGGADKLVILWDTTTGTLLRKLEGHTGEVRGVAFAPARFEAASASMDGALRVWDLKTGHSRAIAAHKGGARGVAYSPDGARLLSGGEDGMVRLWIAATGEEIYRFQGHTKAVTGVAFAPDGRRALSGSDDRTVRFWELPG
jgi:WD40 repeat protein